MRNGGPGTMCHPGVLTHPVSNLGARQPRGLRFRAAELLSHAVSVQLAHLSRGVMLVTLLVGIGLAGIGLAAAL